MDIAYIIIIIGLGFIFVSTTKKSLTKKDINTLNIMWVFHICTSVSYYFYTRNWGGDAFRYWYDSQQITLSNMNDNLFNTHGTQFMVALNYFPTNLMGMGFFANTLLYGLFGFIALVYLYLICIGNIPYNSKFYKYSLFPFLLFLPNLHFWSSGLGKDTVLFLCILMVAFGFMRISKRFPLIIIGLLLSYGLRPHITLMLIVSFSFSYILNRNISLPKRISVLIPLIAIAAFILPSVLAFVKMDKLSMDELDRFSQNQAIGLGNAGSSVDITSYPYPLKVLTFLYRPFFFDINGIPAVVASFENLLLLLLSIQVIRNKPVQTFRAAPLAVQGLFIFFLLGAFVFSMSMSNLGIILRERNMFLPGLILFILWSFSYKQEFTLKKRNV